MTICLVAIVLSALTAIIVLSRWRGKSSDVSFVALMPFLAGLGVLPVIGPSFLFFLEVLGTSRILTAVHRFACLNSEARESFHEKLSTRTLIQYVTLTTIDRLSLWKASKSLRRSLQQILWMKDATESSLLRIPPASTSILEKLGVATALALVDDELACEPHAIPQQLLIPSKKGLKLLDLCRVHDDDIDDGSSSDSLTGRNRGTPELSDSDDSERGINFTSSLRRKVLRRRLRRTAIAPVLTSASDATHEDSFDVQFEDPAWGQYLPSLKCIGLACLLVDDKRIHHSKDEFSVTSAVSEADKSASVTSTRKQLTKHVCFELRSYQLQSLSRCIGFSLDPNSFGPRGDLSFFRETMRLHVVSSELLKARLQLDAHERGSEESRWWGHIRPDSTSVIVQDSRSKAFQLLTVGDPVVVASLCNEAWQGEISTILPLGIADRQTIIDTTNSWKLADLDVAAFSYAPIRGSLEKIFSGVASQVSDGWLTVHAVMTKPF
jgi:hypothetical protein